jgi:methionyl-tRNA formyltransferase
LRIAFAGTPPFAAHALEALHGAGHEIVLVLTQPDRPSGRGLKPKASAVAELAVALGLPVSKPASLKPVESRAPIAAVAPEIMVVAAYGLILPESVLAIPRSGCLNIHASILPRWRGAAPIQRAIQAGDAETGISIMVMERGLDTGPVLLERRIPILGADTAGTLADKLAHLGARAILEALGQLDTIRPRPQETEGVTYAAKIDRSEAPLDWGREAGVLHRQVRAFNPYPGAETTLDGITLKIWDAELLDASGTPGTVVGLDRGRPVVACHSGGLALTVVQRPGSRRMPAAEFVKGHPMPPGTRLGSVGQGNA